MFQIGLAVEVQLAGGVGTLTAGWGLATFAGPWWRNLFGVVYQGAPGVRRYGVVLAGFFVTLQGVDMAGARKALMGEAIKAQSGQKIPRRG